MNIANVQSQIGFQGARRLSQGDKSLKGEKTFKWEGKTYVADTQLHPETELSSVQHLRILRKRINGMGIHQSISAGEPNRARQPLAWQRWDVSTRILEKAKRDLKDLKQTLVKMADG